MLGEEFGARGQFLHMYSDAITQLTGVYTTVILPAMKNTISIPDWLYREAEKTAKDLGIARSRLFALALEEYLRHQSAERITAELDAVYTRVSGDASATASGVSALHALTADDRW